MTTEYKHTPIGNIPRDWDIVRIENVCVKIKAGGTPLTSKREYYHGEIPFVKIEDLTNSNKWLENTADTITKIGLENSSAWIVPPHSILFAMYGSIGAVAINRIPVATNQAILGIIPKNERVDVEFLYYLLSYLKPHFERWAKQTTQANLTARIVRNFKIPLPPFDEQQKIAEALSGVDDAIRRVDLAIAKTERLKKGLMQKLLTEGLGHKEFKETKIGKIPKTWKVLRLGDVANLESGGTPNRQKPEYWKNGTIPWVKSGELNDGFLYSTEEKISVSGLKNSSAKIFRKGTLLIALYGRGTVSKTAILGIDAATNQAVGAIIPTNNLFDPKFMQQYIIFSRNKLLNQMVNPSSDVGRTNIYLTSLKLFRIALPPLKEQQKITGILLTIDRKLELERLRKERLVRIKRGLMSDLLTGRRRVKVAM